MLKPIKTKKDCDIALERVFHLMQKEIVPNSKESDELEILSILKKDSEFLRDNNILDYSLLLNIEYLSENKTEYFLKNRNFLNE
jgi:antitoxin component HigA of HigAB toxin-antitoxin module